MGAVAKPGPGPYQSPAGGKYQDPCLPEEQLPPLSGGNDRAAFSRRGPCSAPGSCCCCGSWCWWWVALSTSSGLAAGCVPSALPGALSQSPSCSECTSPSSPPVTGTEPAAPTGPSTGLPTAAALGRLPPGPATPAARAGRGPAGSPGPAEQQYAGHRARTEGPASSQAAVTALQDGRVTPARQARTAPSRRKCRDSGHGWTSWSRSCSSCLPHCTAWPRGPWSMGSQTPAASWLTPSSSWTASTL
ncbi:epidermal growth factor-like protein 7 isoform X4 [Lontra canadensis]|uniref:epidermal growth factor-like protein 7 isoform X4 n=1 Tax=Lontra canadensis TaxID=76717 RepID=UPI0013F3509D|nr:epidermal growth factor-like protein 7 isoform X4 [Lontra canadensis]